LKLNLDLKTYTWTLIGFEFTGIAIGIEIEIDWKVGFDVSFNFHDVFDVHDV